MKPKQKGDYVRHMRSIAGTAVAFCGDGTNDTCALKNGDLGLALSEEDASLAAPFTSHVFNVSAMVKLIK
jgi:cation-transporting ATPase 13A3/4/5